MRKALVLGERVTSLHIAEMLERSGYSPIPFEVFSRGQSLPRQVNPGSINFIKAILEDFSRFSEKEGLVHPGNTFWGERPEFASICLEQGLTPVSPSSRVLSLFSNKLSFLLEAEKLKIPHLVQDFEPMYSVREVLSFIDRRRERLPLVLKSIKGGRSFGLFLLHDKEGLKKNLELWCDQVRLHLGEVIFFAEKYLESAREITLPFVRFRSGELQVFPAIDSSLQCYYRKVIEFCPSGRLDSASINALSEMASRYLDHCDYVGVGCLKFLVDSSRAYLINGLPRLNTGFRLWEKVANCNAVQLQLKATGVPFIQKNPEGIVDPPEEEDNKAPRFGVSLRIHAEDSLLHLPQPGYIQEVSQQRFWNFPGASAEVTFNYKEKEEVPIADSGLLGMVTAVATSRQQVLALVRGVLNEVWISGSVQTNEQFLIDLLHHPWVREEIFHAGFIDEEFIPTLRPPLEWLKVMAAVAQCAKLKTAERVSQNLKWIVGVQWFSGTSSQLPVLEWEEAPVFYEVSGVMGLSGRLKLQDGSMPRVSAFPIGNRWMIRLGCWFATARTPETPNPSEQKVSTSELKKKLFALFSGRIHSILYRPGTRVPAHEPLLIMESFGILIPHALPCEVEVLDWKVEADNEVRLGQELADIEVKK